jgi:hypothetical protein
VELGVDPPHAAVTLAGDALRGAAVSRDLVARLTPVITAGSVPNTRLAARTCSIRSMLMIVMSMVCSIGCSSQSWVGVT